MAATTEDIRNCTEIKRLAKMLDDAHIPFVLTRRFPMSTDLGQSNYHLEYPVTCFEAEKHRGWSTACSVIQGHGTYGMEKNLLEIMGLLTPEELENDTVRGHLTAEEVFERISKHWVENRGKYCVLY